MGFTAKEEEIVTLRYRRPYRWFGPVVALALVLAACGTDPGGEGSPAESVPAEGSPGDQAGETQTLTLGAAVSLTGPVSREGNLVRDGYEYWMTAVNEQGGIQVGDETYMVELIVYDDEGDANTAAQLTERLITEDDVDFLLGPFSSGITQATSTIGERNGVLTIAPQANADGIYERDYKYIFSILPAASTYLRGVIDMAATLEPAPETVAVMIRDDPFGIAAGEGAANYAEEQGFEVVFSESYPANATDVSSILTAVESAEPDMLLASTLFQDSVLITRQAKDLQFAPSLMGFTAGPALPDFVDSLGEDANFVMGSEWWLPSLSFDGEETLGSTQDYAAGIEEEFGYLPGYHTASGSMAGLVLQLALEQAGTTDTDAVREALLALEPQTFWGPIGWDESGKNVVGTSIPVQILDGTPTSVWPEEGRESEPTYPFPSWDER